MPSERPPRFVEWLGIIAILPILAAILIPPLQSSRQLGLMRRTQTESSIDQLRSYNGWTVTPLDKEARVVMLTKTDVKPVYVRLSPEHFQLVCNMRVLDVSVLEAMDRLQTENK